MTARAMADDRCPVCDRPGILQGGWFISHTDPRTGYTRICPASGQSADDSRDDLCWCIGGVGPHPYHGTARP